MEPGLFAVKSTGVSTAPVRQAAESFLAALSPEQRRKTMFDVKDDEWRKWMNQSFYVRQGVSFDEMSAAQRDAAFGLMRASLSARGLTLTRNIMRLNHTLGELNDNNFAEYGEWLYHITVMGTPSATEPWGWQFDGHHAVINYFVLGDQVVMTPYFAGSEPVIAKAGKFKGTSIMEVEQSAALAMINGLDASQRAKAVLKVSKTGNEILTEAWRDNVVLDYAGHSGLRAVAGAAAAAAGARGPLRRQHGRGPREGEDGRGGAIPGSHLLRLDRRHHAGQRVLLPHPQPGGPDRVRSPAARESSAPQ